jgi:hypothetical protein
LELEPIAGEAVTVKITRKVLEGLTGIKPRRTEFYILQDLYDDLEVSGRGSPTFFKERHIAETYLINELRVIGLELTRIKTIINLLRGDGRFRRLFDNTGNLKRDVKKDYTPKTNVRNCVFIWGHAAALEFASIRRGEKRWTYKDPMDFFTKDSTVNPMSGEKTGMPPKTALIVEITEIFEKLATL